jgi:hypothetical protein
MMKSLPKNPPPHCTNGKPRKGKVREQTMAKLGPSPGSLTQICFYCHRLKLRLQNTKNYANRSNFSHSLLCFPIFLLHQGISPICHSSITFDFLLSSACRKKLDRTLHSSPLRIHLTVYHWLSSQEGFLNI